MPSNSTVRRFASPTIAHSTDLGWVITSLTWLIVIWLISGVAGEPDIWGHLRFGLDVLSTRQIPTDDPYSFTQDRPMLYHEWLTGVLMAAAYKAGGFPAIVLLKLVVMLGIFWILWRAWRHVHPLVTLPVLIVTALGAGPIVHTTRPHMWTLFALLLLLSALRQPLTPLRVMLVGAIFVAWANLHGGVILGLGVLGVWCAVSAFRTWHQTRVMPWHWLLLPVVGAAGTLVNPYGIDLWEFLLTTVRPNRDIAEWQPLWMHVPQLWVPFVVVVVSVIVWRLWPSWPATAVILMLWYGGITVSRIAYLAVPVTVLLVAPVAARRWPRSAWQWRAPSRSVAALMLIPVVSVALALVPLVREPFSCIPIGDQDPAGLGRLKATKDSGRLAVWFTWGQYALWHLSPRLKVSWDGRRETLYSEAAQQTQKAVAFGLPEGDRWLATIRPEYVWLPARFNSRREWLQANGYRLDHDTSTSFIAVRSDLPPLPEAVASGSCVE